MVPLCASRNQSCDVVGAVLEKFRSSISFSYFLFIIYIVENLFIRPILSHSLHGKSSPLSGCAQQLNVIAPVHARIVEGISPNFNKSRLRKLSFCQWDAVRFRNLEHESWALYNVLSMKSLGNTAFDGHEHCARTRLVFSLPRGHSKP